MDQVRHFLAVAILVTLPPGLLFWFLIHPWVRTWRTLGPARTYVIVISVLIAFGALLFRFRERLLGADFGTNWELIAVGLILFGISNWLHVELRRRLSITTMIGLPELSSAEARQGTLLKDGVYRMVRHPRYLSASIGGLAFALIVNYMGVYVLAIVAIPTLYAVTMLEEHELMDRFGDEYRTYQREVPRLIPRWPKSNEAGRREHGDG